MLTSPLASSSTSAVRPKAKVSASPSTSTTTAVRSRSRRRLILVSRCAWSSLAMWYSAFSLRSPSSRATLIRAAILVRAEPSSCSISSRSAAIPSSVIASPAFPLPSIGLTLAQIVAFLARGSPERLRGVSHLCGLPACLCLDGAERDLRDEELHQVGIELVACRAPYLTERFGGLHPRAVGPRPGHRAVCVADQDDARPERYRRSGEPVRVATAVPVLVAGANDLRDLQQRRGSRQHALPDQRVLLHQFLLRFGERAVLVEDLVWDGDLADVVHLRGPDQDVDVLGFQLQGAAHLGGEARHVSQVPVEARFALAQQAEQHAAGLAQGGVGALSLLRVHAAVGDPQGGGRRLGFAGQLDPAPRGPDREAGAAIGEGGLGGLDDHVGFRLADRGEHAELVAAEAVGPAPGNRRGGQIGAEALEQLVAGGVAEAVVVRLEAVEVEEGKDMGSPVLAGK